MGVPSLEVTLSCDTTSSFPTGLEEPDVLALPRGMMPQTKALTPSTVQTAQLPRIHLPRGWVNSASPHPDRARRRRRGVEISSGYYAPEQRVNPGAFLGVWGGAKRRAGAK